MAKRKKRPPRLYQAKKKRRASPIMLISVVGLIIMVGSLLASLDWLGPAEPEPGQGQAPETEPTPETGETQPTSKWLTDSQILEHLRAGKTVIRSVDFPTSQAGIYLSEYEGDPLYVLERINYNRDCTGNIEPVIAGLCPADPAGLPVIVVYHPGLPPEVHTGAIEAEELQTLVLGVLAEAPEPKVTVIG